MQLEVKLSEEEVKEAILLYLSSIHELHAKKVEIVVGNVSSGNGVMETVQPGFKYVRCEIDK